MAVSDTARLDVVLRCQLHAIVAAIARRYRSRHVDCYLPSSGFRGDSPGMDLATLDTRDGADGISRQRETGTAALSADMGRRMNPIRAGSASQCPSPCVGLDGRKVHRISQFVLLEEDVRWGARLSHVV
jgi:hypothetical protein